MIRVLVVDDHPFVRAGVSVVLGQALGIEVVGQCADGDQVVGMAAAVHPDVVLMDVQMPVTSGPEATRSLLACQPLVRVLMLTGTMAGAALNESARAGAVGCLFKSGDPDQLVDAVRTVAAGGTVWPQGLGA